MQKSDLRIYGLAVLMAAAVHIPLAVYEIKSTPPQKTAPERKMTVTLVKKTTEQAKASAVPTPMTPKTVRKPEPEIIKKAPAKKQTPVKKKAETVTKPAEPVHTSAFTHAETVPKAPQAVSAPAAQAKEELPEPEFDMGAYENRLVSLVEKNKSYPYMARRKGHEGLVEISLRIAPGGQMAEAAVKSSSGSQILDREALRLVQSILPLENDSKKEIVLTIPIRYRLD
jgi:protein TonB